MAKVLKLYTDGACSKNGQALARAGWGAVGVVNDEVVFEIFGRITEKSTNQVAELAACLNGLHYCKEKGYSIIEVYTDSAYLCNCVKDKWWVNWEKNNWLNAKKNPVANKELWEKLIPYFKNTNIVFNKVAGHSGDKYNEIADDLARRGVGIN